MSQMAVAAAMRLMRRRVAGHPTMAARTVRPISFHMLLMLHLPSTDQNFASPVCCLLDGELGGGTEAALRC